MKVLLLQPPIQDFYDTDVRLLPVGLGYLKSAAVKFLPGVSVTVRDYHHGWGRRTVRLPEELSYLRSYYREADKSPFSVFHQYYHYGASYDELAADAAALAPDLIGISSLFSPYYREVLDTARAIKTRIGVPIVAGGSHASALPETLLACPDIDFVVRGEGERAFVELVRALRDGEPLEGVPNLTYRQNGGIRSNAIRPNYPIDEIPMPDLSDFDDGRYAYDGKAMSVIITSRGCPYHCRFCSVHRTFSEPYRRRTHESILEEIRARYDRGVRVFDFEDDNLTYERGPCRELFETVAGRYPSRDIQLLAMNGVSYWDLDDDLLETMHRAGFTHLNLSLVSANPDVSKNCRRPLDLEKHRRVALKAFGLGMKVVTYQILGLPGEDLESTVRGLVHAAELPGLIGASPFYLPPGSPLFESSPQRRLNPVTARLTALGGEVASLPPDRIYTLLVLVRILNFLKGLPVAAPEISLSDCLSFARKGDSRMRLGAEILDELLQTGNLLAETSSGRVKLEAFRTDVFSGAWKCFRSIRTQGGEVIHAG